MKIVLIRHGRTYGNTLQRYLGVTEEPLLEEEEELLETIKKEKRYPDADRIFVSPRLRCRQTGACLYPEAEQLVIEELAECDFGMFENRNWRELTNCPEYQQWIDSGGILAFPGGEDPAAFRRRCCLGFEKAVEQCIENQWYTAVFVVHGGTIMSILERYARPERAFYDWKVKNREGYLGTLDSAAWQLGDRKIEELVLVK